MTRKVADAAAEKQRRQKLILAGLGVVLVAVLAFELPSLRGSGGGTSQPDTPLVHSASPPRPTAPALVDTGAQPQPAEGQLASLRRFQVHDPFAGAPVDGVSDAKGAAPTAPATDSKPAPAAQPAPRR